MKHHLLSALALAILLSSTVASAQQGQGRPNANADDPQPAAEAGTPVAENDTVEVDQSEAQAQALQAGKPATAPQPPTPEEIYKQIVASETAVRDGMFKVHSVEGHILFEIPQTLLGKEMFWYAEVVSVSPEIQGVLGNSVGSALVVWKRSGNMVEVTDLTDRSRNRATFPNVPLDPDEAPTSHEKIDPVERAVDASTLAPIMLQFPILAEGPGGSLVIDVTKIFSADISEFSVRVPLINEFPIAVADKDRSVITSVKVFPRNINIRSTLTFDVPALPPELALVNRGGPMASISVKVGHVISLLPDTPMKARRFDPRIGFFAHAFNEFQDAEETGVVETSIILRRRLEKKNPNAATSDPVDPIVFYIGRDVPDKWRPFLKEAVEAWQPAFEKAGFSNAIIAKDAPTVSEDPNWEPEDSRWNVIRWIAQPIENAMGPNVHDPRSGEILSSHILVWADVLKLIEQWYFVQASVSDESARNLPISDEILGQALQYVVAHEVGHTLGLRHNFKASQAFTSDQLRDPEFTDMNGTTASIMSYGRFNFVAQPEDGVTNLLPQIGPYDEFAISWGYTPIPDAKTVADEVETLNKWAEKQAEDPWLAFGGEDFPAYFDPTVLTEVIGKDRIEVTKLGVANLERVLGYLVEGTTYPGSDFDQLQEIYEIIVETRQGWFEDVTKMVGGVVEDRTLAGSGKPQFTPVTAEEQRQAALYVLREGLADPEPFLDPNILNLFLIADATEPVARAQKSILNALLSGRVYSQLHQQAILYPEIDYTISMLLDDVTAEVWSELADDEPEISPLRRALQRHHLERILEQFDNQDDPIDTDRLTRYGVPEAAAEILLSSGQGTDFPANAGIALKQLGTKIEGTIARVKDPATRNHLVDAFAKIKEVRSLEYED